MAKEAEARLVQIAKHYKWGWRRYGDVKKAVCSNCKKTILKCPICKEDLLLPKSERMPDYLLAPIETAVECKNSNETERWNWKDDIGPEGARHIQREYMENNGGWLLIELGNGPAPNGKSAYLVPWGMWKNIERELTAHDMASIRKETKGTRPGADELLADFRLEWETKVGWTIPKGHIWWKAYRGKLLEQLAIAEEML